jgi:hypothetical protein
MQVSKTGDFFVEKERELHVGEPCRVHRDTTVQSNRKLLLYNIYKHMVRYKCRTDCIILAHSNIQADSHTQNLYEAFSKYR